VDDFAGRRARPIRTAQLMTDRHASSTVRWTADSTLRAGRFAYWAWFMFPAAAALRPWRD
jgi:hypothetical protein